MELNTASTMEVGDLESPGREDKVRYPTTYMETLAHYLTATIGVGMFAMGDAFKHSGLLAGCLLTAIIGIINAHCQHILLRCSEAYKMESDDNNNISSGLSETVEICFQQGPQWLRPWASNAKMTADLFIFVMQLGECAVYIVFIARNVQKISSAFGYDIDIHAYMAAIFVLIILECLIKNLKYIAPISMLANLLMFVGIAITLYYAAQDLPPISQRRLMGDVQNLPLFFAAVIYAVDIAPMVIPLKREMKNPSQFQRKLGVLNVGMFVVIILLIASGFLGYVKWGDHVEGSMTLNLPKDSNAILVLQGILASAILFTLPIQFYILVDLIRRRLKARGYGGCFRYETVLRLCLVLISLICAEVIPHLSIFIALVGGTCSIAVALIIPALLDLLVSNRRSEKPRWTNITKNCLIILVGAVASVAGTYEALHELVNKFYYHKTG